MMSGVLLFSSLLPLLALAQQSPPPSGNNGGTDNPPDPSDAGAEGASKGAFSLSSGALAAIIVVACIVIIGGSMCLSFHELNKAHSNASQLLRQPFGGLQRNDNGTFVHQFVAPLVASLVAPQPKANRIA